MATVARICTLENCTRETRALGLCDTHYRRKKQGLDPAAAITRKSRKPREECLVIGCVRISDFKNLCGTHYRNSLRHHIPVNEYVLLMDSPCGCCGTFTATLSDRHIDHDHTCCPGTYSCGKCVRGILCNTCNVGIGFFHDSVEKLQQAINYLQRMG